MFANEGVFSFRIISNPTVAKLNNCFYVFSKILHVHAFTYSVSVNVVCSTCAIHVIHSNTVLYLVILTFNLSPEQMQAVNCCYI